MNGTGVNKVRHGHLVDPPKALVIRMSDDLADELIIYTDESIYRVVDDLMKTHDADRLGC